MFTSDIEARRSACLKTVLAYLLISLFCALFGAVYERFSHEVYAYTMLYAFAFPLAGGVLPFLLILCTGRPFPNKPVRSAYHAGIATLTVGSLVSGALEIYGTTSALTAVYRIAGAALCGFGLIGYLIACIAEKRH